MSSGVIKKMAMPESGFGKGPHGGPDVYGFNKLTKRSTSEGLFFSIDGRLRGSGRLKAIQTVYRAAHYYAKKNDLKFSCRVVDGGLMVYRIK